MTDVRWDADPSPEADHPAAGGRLPDGERLPDSGRLPDGERLPDG